MKTSSAALVALLVALVGCGGDGAATGAREQRTPPAVTPESSEARGTRDSREATETDAREAAKGKAPGQRGGSRGTQVTTGGSAFGEMLFGPGDQAIYIFENDARNQSTCYGECAKAWPPVLTKDRPVADGGVKRSLLGTVKRRDGTVQVSYAGQPLYYYAHEGPGEVRCHDIDLNGGYWWVVGPDGKRRP